MQARNLMTALVVLGAMVVGQATAVAGEKSLLLSAPLHGKGVGLMRVELTPKYRNLKLKIQNSPPDMTIIVALHRGNFAEKIGWVHTDKFGQAQLHLDTRRGQAVPAMQHKDMIRLWFQNHAMMSGRLQAASATLSGY